MSEKHNGKIHIPNQCHYEGLSKDPYDLDLEQYIKDKAPAPSFLGGSQTLAQVLAEGNNADGGTIENLADPTTDQQAATKKYVDDNAGGSSYFVWDAAYQNSAMSSPVGVYLWKDESDNIYGAYEPTMNNWATRAEFSYADTIDLVQFDNPDWCDNRFLDTKLLGLGTGTKIEGSVLETMVIKCNSFTGLEIINHKQKGLYGNELGFTNDAEISISGNDVKFYGNTVNGGG